MDIIETATSRGSAYAELSRLIKKAGLLDRRPGYYIVHAGLLGAACVASLLALVLIGDSWWQMAVAVVFAVLSTQLGFLGHDAGHRQIFTSGRANRTAGTLLANLGVAFSYEWWTDKHNRHHAHPNDEEKDPDVGVAGPLAFTAGQVRRAAPVARFFHRFQAWLFFPVLLLEALNLRVSSVTYLLQKRGSREIRELALITVHLAAYFTLVFLVLSPLKAVVFILVHQGLFGLYLGCAFAPNHKGMPSLSEADAADYLLRQVLTSRNVRGFWATDILLGGLNYQIEHHLFPSMPRPNLRRSQRIVRDFCRDREISYLETSLVASYAQAVRHLDTVGRTPAG
ncbi:acyl-CoA desaturase [Actinoplanes sp. NEAU-A12]|uniref:Acyl-CoA desaturase n=1 Tax=Actinoplanes sandaracinus TaxID=3045177 RepID=A0ABT6WRX9_9ACTN|nr:acyl-CoA desaturase [Actinoplanes sandaracinus]MDI6102492.1 acyl-CoA desaturase [Actinoplanes sandaracinus]